jgi:hypothetical protein
MLEVGSWKLKVGSVTALRGTKQEARKLEASLRCEETSLRCEVRSTSLRAKRSRKQGGWCRFINKEKPLPVRAAYEIFLDKILLAAELP